LIAVALLGAVLAQRGKTMLGPFAVALVIMGIVAALGGAASWFGLTGSWRRSTGVNR
jgi:type IV secretory pathway VirB2 component (pilin)